MAMAETAGPNKDPKTFGEAFKNLRIQKRLSYEDVAYRIRKSKEWTRNLEKDLIVLRKQDQPKLFAEFPQLRHYIHLLPTAYELVSEQPPKNEPIPDLSAPKVPRKFKDALRYFRVEAGLGRDELAELCGVSVSSITHWEAGDTIPVLENYNKLLDLFPGLEDVEEPSSKDIPKPRGAEGMTFEGRKRKEIGKVTPLFPDYSTDKTQSVQSDNEKTTLRHKPFKEKAVSLLSSPSPKSSVKKEEKYTELSAAASIHAESLVKVRKAKARKEELEELVSKAKEEVEEAERELEEAKILLQKAVDKEANKS